MPWNFWRARELVRTWTPEESLGKKRDFARGLRNRQTPAESLLWDRIRGRRLGARFRRQHVILGWIADFYCPKARLVIEVDGSSHDDRKAKDAIRDAAMGAIGLMVLRFSNTDVYDRMDWVLDTIRETLVPLERLN